MSLEPEILKTFKAADTFEQLTITLDRAPAAGATVLAQIRDAVDVLVHQWSTAEGTAVINGRDIVLARVAPAQTRAWPVGIHGFEVQLISAGKTTTQIYREELAIEVYGDGAYVE
ncbi:hypothetical protein [Nevskia ramosa]|uniref:hypothetical protein n=1 Tax=Nevskia ramosa TaxID=64002 RepID=UPI0023550514|nr:hypothetical protein [Nevskia ramosa]